MRGILAYYAALRRHLRRKSFIRYTTRNLIGLADGAQVLLWQNEGAAGENYNLVPYTTYSSAGSITYHAAAGGEPAYVRFTDQVHLASTGVLPNNGFAGNSPRTFGLEAMVEDPPGVSGATNCGLLSYGFSPTYAQYYILNELAAYGSGLAFDAYATSLFASNVVVPNVRFRIVGRLTPLLAASSGQPNAFVELFHNGVLASSGQLYVNTAQSQLHVGGSSYASGSTDLPRRIYKAFAVPRLLTNDEIAAF